MIWPPITDTTIANIENIATEAESFGTMKKVH